MGSERNSAYYTPYQHGEIPKTAYSYKNFCLLPYIDFYWVNEPHLKDRYVTIGWLLWEFDIPLIRHGDI